MEKMHPNRWTVLWRAVVKWWKNEPPKPMPLPQSNITKAAQGEMVEYHRLYAERIKLPFAQYGAASLSHVSGQKIKRAPGVDSEIRTLAAVLEHILLHLEYETQRQVEIHRRSIDE